MSKNRRRRICLALSELNFENGFVRPFRQKSRPRFGDVLGARPRPLYPFLGNVFFRRISQPLLSKNRRRRICLALSELNFENGFVRPFRQKSRPRFGDVLGARPRPLYPFLGNVFFRRISQPLLSKNRRRRICLALSELNFDDGFVRPFH